MDRLDPRQLVAAGVFGIATALMNTFFYLAIDRVDLGKAVTIEFIGPITVAAVATRSMRNAVALLFAIGGVVVLGQGEIDGNAIGLLFILAGVDDVGGVHRGRLEGRPARSRRRRPRHRAGDRCHSS